MKGGVSVSEDSMWREISVACVCAQGLPKRTSQSQSAMSLFAKFLLAYTAMSPLLVAVAVEQLASNRPWTSWVWWLAAAALLVVLCHCLLRYARTNHEVADVEIATFERTDQELLAFLLAYLLPFVSSDNLLFTDQWPAGAYILAIVGAAIVHADALHFNPVMGFLRYHFYSITDAQGRALVLISKRHLARPTTVVAIELAPRVHLHREDL